MAATGDVEMRDANEKDSKSRKSEKSSHRSSKGDDSRAEEKHKRKDKDKDREHKHKSKHKDRHRDKEKPSEKDSRPLQEEGELAAQPSIDAPGGASGQRAEPSPRQSGGEYVGGAAPAERPASPVRPEAPAAQPDSAPAAQLPPDFKPQVNDSNGEVSMSFEETNRMRIAMGLKPLRADGGPKAVEDKERAAGKARRDAAAKEAEAAELRKRIESARDKRKMEQDLAKVRGLGAAEPEVDDLSAWVSRSRQSEAEAKRAAERAAAAKVASMYDEEDEDEASEGEAPFAAELAGMKVRHSAEELGAGETIIMTLADRNILNEKGDLDDDGPVQLENVLAAEDKKRKKARAAAVKPNGPDYDEDGQPKGLLTKYDEEEADAGMQIDASGAVADEKARKQAEIRRKLAEGSQSLASDAAAPAIGGAGDYYTKEEMASFAKPKRRKVKKKLRKRGGDDDDADAAPNGTAEAVALLEQEAAAASGGASAAAAGDHGSRRDRGAARQAKADADAAAEEKRRRDRYEAALSKANYATLAASMAPEESAIGGSDDEDEMRAALEDSMRRSRRAGAKPGRDSDAVMADIIRRREAEEAAGPSTAASAAGSELITETAEFARLVGQRDDDTGAAPADADEGGHMDVDAAPSPPRAKAEANGAAAASTDEKLPPPPPPKGQRQLRVKKEEPQDDSGIREKPVGRGLAGVLSLLNERGELGKDLKAVEWAGRTNDMKPVALQGLETVYTGGRSANALENSVERALTRRDKHGRVLTPKEAFRELCHNFHGIYPSKDKQQRQIDKDAETAAAKRAATSENPDSLRRLQSAQKQTATPYVVLSGSVRPGQTSDPASGYATATGYESARTPHGRASVAQTPVLGGGATPLVGDRKVEAMLGLKRPAAVTGSMPPPPPARKQKQ